MYEDVSRPPLDAVALRRSLVDGGEYTALDVVTEIDSTNAELLRRATDGAGDRTVLCAEHQISGRGRSGRSWEAPPRSQLAFSVLLRPGMVSPLLAGWLPLVTGLGVHDALTEVAKVDARLKWPNDVLVDGRKLAGILVEMTTVTGGGDFGFRLPALVVGVGLNVSLTEDELPVPHATSLALCGGLTDRLTLARAVLRSLSKRHSQWRDCERGSGSSISPELRAEYEAACATIGSDVRVDLPGEKTLEGRAVSVDTEGRLVVSTKDGKQAVAAGDVNHVRRPDDGWKS